MFTLFLIFTDVNNMRFNFVNTVLIIYMPEES